MGKTIIYIAVIGFFIFNSTVSFGQNKFSVSIRFPKELESQKVELSYDNGRIVKKVPILLHQNTIIISDSFYFRYAIINIHIDSNRFNLPAFSSFFVDKKPADITFKKNADANSGPFRLFNAYDRINMGIALDKYTAPEQEAIAEIWSRPAAADSIDSLNMIAMKNLLYKELDFIRHNKEQYFYFSFFRTNIAPNFFMDPDSMMHFYKTNFPANLRNTPEGKEIMKILYGRKIAISENMIAPYFKVIDIHGKQVELKDCKGKYVLINFWASWCIPCVGELPAIKKISDRYFPGKLIIITNTIDRDTLAFLAAIKKYGMSDWVNTYNSADLERKFGGVAAIPQLFLIDPKGQIIYNRNFKPIDNDKLTRLNKILKERIQ